QTLCRKVQNRKEITAWFHYVRSLDNPLTALLCTLRAWYCRWDSSYRARDYLPIGVQTSLAGVLKDLNYRKELPPRPFHLPGRDTRSLKPQELSPAMESCPRPRLL